MRSLTEIIREALAQRPTKRELDEAIFREAFYMHPNDSRAGELLGICRQTMAGRRVMYRIDLKEIRTAKRRQLKLSNRV